MFFDQAIYSFDDARRLARRRLPRMVFDYIDGAAGTEHGEGLNRDMLKNIWLQPRILNNVEHRSVSADLFGKKTQLPFGIAPMGMCNMASPDADKCFAKLAAKYQIPVGVSTLASTSLEDMITLADGHAWFQLYISGAMEEAGQLLQRCKAAQYETVVLTVDVPEIGRRPRELRHGFKMPFRIGPRQFLDFASHPGWSLSQLCKGRPRLANFGGSFGEFDRTRSRAGADWDMLAKIRERWQGKLVVKGVLSAEDAVQLKAAGVDAIQVSSHGGRQLDGSIPAILALRDIRNAVGPKLPLFYDSGLRSGEDVVKAYALGASFAFLGRPFSMAIAAAGHQGVLQMADILSRETSITLAQLGLRNLSDISADVIANPQLPRQDWFTS